MEIRKKALGFSSLVKSQGPEMLLKNLGLKATKQRQRALSILYENGGPMTVESMISKIDIDPGTLYRILEVFEKVSLVRKIDFREKSFFYEINNMHHHHIVCKSCKDIEEIDICGIEKIIPWSKKFSNIFEHSLEFFGICKTCSKS